MARRAVMALAGVLVLGVVLLGLPWATQRQDRVASVPVAPDLERISLVRLAPASTACTSPVVFSPDSARALFIVRAGAGGRPALRVRTDAPGYREAAEAPAGPPGRAVQTVALRPAARDTAGELCIANAGRVPVALEASASARRAATRVDGRPARAAVVLTLLESRRSSVLGRLGTIADRVSAFRPVGPVFLVLLAIAVLALLVVGVPWALARALGADQDLARPGLRRRAGSSTSRQDKNASA